jgi:hypothetical protein
VASMGENIAKAHANVSDMAASTNGMLRLDK